MNYEMPDRDMCACMDDCLECARMCALCSHHCLHMGEDHASPHHQGVMHDCQEICELAASFMSRDSEHAIHICRECAEICVFCADSCEKRAEGDSMMLRCADACRQCAETCDRMSSQCA